MSYTTCPIAGPVALRWTDGRDHIAFIVADHGDFVVDLMAVLTPDDAAVRACDDVARSPGVCFFVDGTDRPTPPPTPIEHMPLRLMWAYVRRIPLGNMEGTEPRPSWYEPAAYPYKERP